MSVLSEKLKAKGLDASEELVKLVVEELFELADLAAKESENKIDDAAVGLALPLVKSYLMPLVDKIDGVKEI